MNWDSTQSSGESLAAVLPSLEGKRWHYLYKQAYKKPSPCQGEKSGDGRYVCAGGGREGVWLCVEGQYGMLGCICGSWGVEAGSGDPPHTPPMTHSPCCHQ